MKVLYSTYTTVELLGQLMFFVWLGRIPYSFSSSSSPPRAREIEPFLKVFKLATRFLSSSPSSYSWDCTKKRKRRRKTKR